MYLNVWTIFMNFFSSPKTKNFLIYTINIKFKNNYFQKILNSNFTNGICVISKHSGSEEAMMSPHSLSLIYEEL